MNSRKRKSCSCNNNNTTTNTPITTVIVSSNTVVSNESSMNTSNDNISTNNVVHQVLFNRTLFGLIYQFLSCQTMIHVCRSICKTHKLYSTNLFVTMLKSSNPKYKTIYDKKSNQDYPDVVITQYPSFLPDDVFPCRPCIYDGIYIACEVLAPLTPWLDIAPVQHRHCLHITGLSSDEFLVLKAKADVSFSRFSTLDQVPQLYACWINYEYYQTSITNHLSRILSTFQPRERLDNEDNDSPNKKKQKTEQTEEMKAAHLAQVVADGKKNYAITILSTMAQQVGWTANLNAMYHNKLQESYIKLTRAKFKNNRAQKQDGFEYTYNDTLIIISPTICKEYNPSSCDTPRQVLHDEIYTDFNGNESAIKYLPAKLYMQFRET